MVVRLEIGRGEKWETKVVGSSSYTWTGIAYGDGKLIAVGYYSSHTCFATSTNNGETWTVNTLDDIKLKHIDYHRTLGMWLAIGDSGKIAHSSNGTNWTVETYGSNNWVDLAQTPNGWTVVGTSGYIATCNANSGFMVTTSTYGSGGFVSVAYNNSIWLAYIEKEKSMVISNDGINWTTYYNSPSRNVTKLRYINSKWFLLTSSAEVYVSSDTNSWTKTTVPDQYYCTLYDIAYLNGTYIVVGSSGAYDGIAISNDYTNWHFARGTIIGFLNGVVASNKFIICGNSGRILIEQAVQQPYLLTTKANGVTKKYLLKTKQSGTIKTYI